jgi:anti-sigma B factor antagonist
MPADLSPPQLNLRVETRGDETVVVCSGWLTAEFTPKFKSEVKGLIPGSKRLVLDLAPLTYMDSSGIGAVVGVYVSARTAGCAFHTMNMSKHVRELFKMTHLLTVFEATGPAPTKFS